MVQRVKMEEKASLLFQPGMFISDLRLGGNKPSWEVESHGKSLLLHKKSSVPGLRGAEPRLWCLLLPK